MGQEISGVANIAWERGNKGFQSGVYKCRNVLGRAFRTKVLWGSSSRRVIIGTEKHPGPDR